jgi:uncharacterized membrane protein (UPF0127 family)
MLSLMVVVLLAFGFNASAQKVQGQSETLHAQEQRELTPLRVATARGVVTFQVELALSDDQRMTGLMFRKTMARDHGMLFDFLDSRMVLMWMKNTYLPLDMVFIDENGRIASIAENTTPHSLAVVSSGVPVRYVLELNAGVARQAGLAEGQLLEHALFQK